MLSFPNHLMQAPVQQATSAAGGRSLLQFKGLARSEYARVLEDCRVQAAEGRGICPAIADYLNNCRGRVRPGLGTWRDAAFLCYLQHQTMTFACSL